jgi:hypothetical protein
VRRAIVLGAVATALLAPATAAAHGLSGPIDPPVPRWLFYYGGAIVLVLSFVALGALWRRPRLAEAAAGRPLPEGLQQVLLFTPLHVFLKVVSFALLVFLVVACFFGDRTSTTNLAAPLVYVAFWLGMPLLVVLFGNVWRVLNPWAAVMPERRPLFTYPERLGRWPAAVLLFLFTALELAYTDPADPRMLGVAIVVYSAITWYGMFLYGRETWLANGEAFSVYLGFLARLAPFAKEHGRLIVRWPLTGLATANARPGTLAFIAVMLGSVSFDGLSRTSFWLRWRYDAIVSSPDYGDLLASGLNLIGLLLMVEAVALTYLLAIAVARQFVKRDNLENDFIFSLVPIAFAYAVAHYFSAAVIQGQLLVRLISDPLGRGWDLFGTADFRQDIGVLSPNAIWYVQVGALVIGHVLGLVLAHDRAVSLFGAGPEALKTQYAMLALMILYTVGGMWLLSQG